MTLSAGFVGSRLVSGEREGREETFVRSRPSRDSRAGTTQVTQQPGDLKTLRDTANQSTLARGPQVILIPETPLTHARYFYVKIFSLGSIVRINKLSRKVTEKQ